MTQLIEFQIKITENTHPGEELPAAVLPACRSHSGIQPVATTACSTTAMAPEAATSQSPAHFHLQYQYCGRMQQQQQQQQPQHAGITFQIFRLTTVLVGTFIIAFWASLFAVYVSHANSQFSAALHFLYPSDLTKVNNVRADVAFPTNLFLLGGNTNSFSHAAELLVDVVVRMTVPSSPRNSEMGNFMVALHLRNATHREGDAATSFFRSSILPYKTSRTQWLLFIFEAASLVYHWRGEQQDMLVLFESVPWHFDGGSAVVELSSPLQTYAAELNMMRKHTSDWQYLATWHPVFAWMLMLILLWPVLVSIFLHKRWLFDLDEAIGTCLDNTVGMVQTGQQAAQQVAAFVHPIVQVGQQAVQHVVAYAQPLAQAGS